MALFPKLATIRVSSVRMFGPAENLSLENLGSHT